MFRALGVHQDSRIEIGEREEGVLVGELVWPGNEAIGVGGIGKTRWLVQVGKVEGCGGQEERLVVRDVGVAGKEDTIGERRTRGGEGVGQ